MRLTCRDFRWFNVLIELGVFSKDRVCFFSWVSTSATIDDPREAIHLVFQIAAAISRGDIFKIIHVLLESLISLL